MAAHRDCPTRPDRDSSGWTRLCPGVRPGGGAGDATTALPSAAPAAAAGL